MESHPFARQQMPQIREVRCAIEPALKSQDLSNLAAAKQMLLP
ncbi:MAG: hypothetical protein AB7E74_13870 [Pirellulales bacterium]